MTCDIRIIQGDDVTLAITAKNLDGQIINLTGATLIFKAVQGNTVAVTKSTGAGITLTDPSVGEFEVELTDTDTGALEGKYYFEVQVTSSLGRVITLRSEDQTLPFLVVLRDVIA